MKRIITYITLPIFLLQILPSPGWAGDAIRPVNLLEVCGGETHGRFRALFPHEWPTYQIATSPATYDEKLKELVAYINTHPPAIKLYTIFLNLIWGKYGDRIIDGINSHADKLEITQRDRDAFSNWIRNAGFLKSVSSFGEAIKDTHSYFRGILPSGELEKTIENCLADLISSSPDATRFYAADSIYLRHPEIMQEVVRGAIEPLYYNNKIDNAILDYDAYDEEARITYYSGEEEIENTDIFFNIPDTLARDLLENREVGEEEPEDPFLYLIAGDRNLWGITHIAFDGVTPVPIEFVINVESGVVTRVYLFKMNFQHRKHSQHYRASPMVLRYPALKPFVDWHWYGDKVEAVQLPDV